MGPSLHGAGSLQWVLKVLMLTDTAQPWPCSRRGLALGWWGWRGLVSTAARWKVQTAPRKGAVLIM